jgi:hypothetical protein
MFLLLTQLLLQWFVPVLCSKNMYMRLFRQSQLPLPNLLPHQNMHYL